MVKLANTVPLKGTALNGHAGSTPAGGTITPGESNTLQLSHTTERLNSKRDMEILCLTWHSNYDKVSCMDNDTVNRNVEIRDLPRRVDDTLKAICLVTGKTKLTIYREALEEYAEKYRNIVGPFMTRISND